MDPYRFPKFSYLENMQLESVLTKTAREAIELQQRLSVFNSPAFLQDHKVYLNIGQSVLDSMRPSIFDTLGRSVLDHMDQHVSDRFGKSVLDSLPPSITDVIGKSAFDAIEKMNFIESFNKTILPFSNVYADIFSHSSRYSEDIARVNNDCSQLEQAGFLPHYTTPLELLDECHSPDELGSALERYYCENWADVRCEIERRIDGYEVDEEAKTTFREALAAHGAGFYRSVCRLVFPEFERIARKEIHNGSLAPIASMPGLKELAGNLDTADTEAFGLYALEFYRRLSEHLYKHVRSDKDIREAEVDPVPMRHAAMHGLVAYSTVKHSLNAVFMFDYVVQVVCAGKRISREMEDRNAA